MTTNTLKYDKRVAIENFVNKLFEWIDSKRQNKEVIVQETVNAVEAMLEANALNVKELNQKAVNETLQELATKDFVRAEIAGVRQEIAEVKQELKEDILRLEARMELGFANQLKWLVGFQIATVGLAVAIIKLL
ncbi:hypothetical protein IP364_04640 [Helicobacter winghamensis]|uniref:hypothetical protein n=1 Tax=Helicobacter winghamensis TaxID=157268 RepID=UPI00279F6A97